MGNIVTALPWSEIEPEKENPVRHTGQEYLKFITTEQFSEASRHFLKHKCYTFAPKVLLNIWSFGMKKNVDVKMVIL